jgi:O-antigen/teichoic acid export membrane protein
LLHDIVRMASGGAIAQAAPLLVTPILTRFYTTTDFGELGVFSTLLMGLSLVVSGRYEIAVPLPEADEDAYDLLSLSLTVTAIASAALLGIGALVLLFAPESALSSLGLTAVVVLGLAPGVMAGSVMQSCSYWLTRTGDFKAVARARSGLGIGIAAASVAFGALGVRHGLVTSMLAGYALTMLAIGAHTWRRLGTLRRMPERARLLAAARGYREFPLLNTPHAALDTLKESATLMIAGGLFGPTVMGLLSQTLRVLRTPMSLIGQAVAQVYYPRAARLEAQGESLEPLTRKTMKGILGVSIPLYLAAFAFGPWFFGAVFGPEWVESGTYARVLAPWLSLVLVLSALSSLPVIKRRQPSALGLNVIETIARFAGILIGGRLGGALGAVAGIAVAGLAIGLVQFAWFRRLARGA